MSFGSKRFTNWGILIKSKCQLLNAWSVLPFSERHLSEGEKNTAMEYANEMYPSLIHIIMKFHSKLPPLQFPGAVTRNVSATEWYNSHVFWTAIHY